MPASALPQPCDSGRFPFDSAFLTRPTSLAKAVPARRTSFFCFFEFGVLHEGTAVHEEPADRRRDAIRRAFRCGETAGADALHAVEAGAPGAGQPPGSVVLVTVDPGNVVLVVVTVGPAVVEVVLSIDVVVVVSAGRVVGGPDVVVVPQADSSTWQPAQSAQTGLRFGRAVPPAQIVAV